MALSPQDKTLLNDFSKSQIGLQKKGLPFPESSLGLGDAIDSLTAAVVVKAQYVVNAVTGAIGTHKLGVTLPAGSIVTRLWTDAASPFTSGGLATVAIEAGATVLLTATAFDAAGLTGVDAQTLAPVKLAAASELEVVVADEALTAGTLNIYVEYLK